MRKTVSPVAHIHEVMKAIRSAKLQGNSTRYLRRVERQWTSYTLRG